MQRVPMLPDQLHTRGVRPGPVVAVPAGTTRLGIAIARKAWAAAGGDAVRTSLEISEDDGATWLPLGGCTSAPGDVRDRAGALVTETTIVIRLPRRLVGRALLARAAVDYLVACEGAVEVILDNAPGVRVPGGLEHHSVTYDNDAENTATAATSVTIAGFVVGNNADRYMIVGVSSWDATSGDSAVSSVTFNGSGTGWAEIITELGPGASINRSTLWGQTAPAVTTASVVVTMGGTCSEISANALSAWGVHQAAPLGTAVSAEGTASPATVNVTAAVNDLVYDVVYTTPSPASCTAGAGQTERANTEASGNTFLVSTEPGASTVTMSWTVTGATEWVQTAVALKAAGGRTSKNTRSFPLGIAPGLVGAMNR